MHVLGTPPAFILSQDQTLHRNCQENLSLVLLPRRDQLHGKLGLLTIYFWIVTLPTTLRLSTCSKLCRQLAFQPVDASAPTGHYIRLNSRESRDGPGTGLLSHAVAHAVSSALERFTTVFGMGTGGTTPPAPPGPDLDVVTKALQLLRPCGLARPTPTLIS